MVDTAEKSAALLEAARILDPVQIPDVHWIDGDALCDCLFQRIGDWNNSYLGRTQRLRICCMYERILDLVGRDLLQTMPYFDPNRATYRAETAPWDSETMDMPVAYWHRQLAVQQGKSLPQIREEYVGRENERPKAVGPHERTQPTLAELTFARNEELHAAGWLLESQQLVWVDDKPAPSRTQRVWNAIKSWRL